MYKLYEHKALNYGFVIISPTGNIGQAKTTISSIKHGYPKANYVCTLHEHMHADDIKEHSSLCRTFVGKHTITSLINAGMKNAPCDEWNFIVIAGSWVRPLLDIKFSYFIESEKDILYPIVDRKINFIDGSINGILIHKKAYTDIGKLNDHNPLEICKLMWALQAVGKGYKFKGVLGARVN